MLWRTSMSNVKLYKYTFIAKLAIKISNQVPTKAWRTKTWFYDNVNSIHCIDKWSTVIKLMFYRVHSTPRLIIISIYIPIQYGIRFIFALSFRSVRSYVSCLRNKNARWFVSVMYLARVRFDSLHPFMYLISHDRVLLNDCVFFSTFLGRGNSGICWVSLVLS